jgi:5-methylcytosine-specific restriction protein A
MLRSKGGAFLRLGTMPDYRSPEATAYRAWYKAKAWRVLRLQQLRTEPLCRMCRDEGRVTAANVVDHMVPHRGDHVLFHDPANLQSLCKPCHDRHAQSRDRTGKLRPVIGLDGWPVDHR